MPRIDINMVPGMNRELPGHALHRDGVSFARVLNNLRPTNGELERRPGLENLAGQSPPTRDGLDGTYKVVHIEELNIQPGSSARYLIITEREIFLGNSDITPTYTDGTVDVTNGSTTVTGNGTAWNTRGIAAENWLKGPDGTWYEIASVTSDTELELSTAYGGANDTGASYTIKRTLDLTGSSASTSTRSIFTARINDDLYIAGPLADGFLSAFGNTIGGGVLKVTRAYDATKTSFSASDVSYVFGGEREIEAGIDFAGNTLVVFGFGSLSDGRLVLVGQFFDTDSNVAGAARVYYSSHLNTAVWSTSPGGFTDIIDYRGSVTAASFSTTSIAIHFENGIEVAEITGQDDPPLRFRPSRATVGAIGPKMVARVPSGQATPATDLFVGADLALYAWNGVNAQAMKASGFSRELVDGGDEIGPATKEDVRFGLTVHDGRRHEIGFLVPFGGITREVRYNYDTGVIWRATYSDEFRAAAEILVSTNGTQYDFSAPERTIYLGVDTDQDRWIMALDETRSSDNYDGGGSTGGNYALFEGLSLSPESEFVIQEILVYTKAPFHASAVPTIWQCKWWGDGKTSGQEITADTLTPMRTAHENDAVRPESVAILKGFDEVPVREFSFAVYPNTTNTLGATITRIQVFVSESTADVRAT